MIDAELAGGGAHEVFLPSGAPRDPGLATGLRDVMASLVDAQMGREPELAGLGGPPLLQTRRGVAQQPAGQPHWTCSWGATAAGLPSLEKYRTPSVLLPCARMVSIPFPVTSAETSTT